MNENLTNEEIQVRAKEIVRYQNFRSKIALEKMSCTMPKMTFDAGVVYLKRGTINKAGLSSRLKDEIDKCVENYVQPLTPNPSERRRRYNRNYQKKDAQPPICKIEVVKKPVTSTFNYGIKVGDCIKMVDSEKEAKAFIRGMRFMEPHAEAVLVEIELSVLEE